MTAKHNRSTGGPDRVTEALWADRQRARRGPKPALSREAIVASAIALADAEGLDALSMQRIADELDCAKMALYRHVPGKAELSAVMLDSALGPAPDLSVVQGGWRPRLHAWAMAAWEGFTLHPWTLDLAAGPRVMGPNELDWLEAGVGALADTGLCGAERLDAIALVGGHVRALVHQRSAATARSKDLEERLHHLIGGVLSRNATRYPQVRAAFADAARSGRQDNALEFGLDRIYDGLAELIARRERSGETGDPGTGSRIRADPHH